MNAKNCPSIPPQLLEYLEKTFPDRSPILEESTDQIRFKSGQVSVVRHLRAIHEDHLKHFTI